MAAKKLWKMHLFVKNGTKNWVTKQIYFANHGRPLHEINGCPDEIIFAH